MAVLRVLYKYGVRFDEGHYVATHMPLAAGVMGPYGLKDVELVKVNTTADGSKPPYQAIYSAYFESVEGLQKAMQDPRIGEVLNDIPNFYDGMPEILIGEVVTLPVPA